MIINIMSDPKVGTGKKPKGSGRRLYTDENPKDTVQIVFKNLQDTRETIKKLERLYKSGARPHIRISQIANVLEQRTRFMKGKSKENALAKRYTEFLKQRTKLKTDDERKKLKFNL